MLPRIFAARCQGRSAVASRTTERARTLAGAVLADRRSRWPNCLQLAAHDIVGDVTGSTLPILGKGHGRAGAEGTPPGESRFHGYLLCRVTLAKTEGGGAGGYLSVRSTIWQVYGAGGAVTSGNVPMQTESIIGDKGCQFMSRGRRGAMWYL